jgi:hypothetical protein
MASTHRKLALLAATVAALAAATVLALLLVSDKEFHYDDPFGPLPSPSAQGSGRTVKARQIRSASSSARLPGRVRCEWPLRVRPA